jgi:hypothetical protein
VLALNDRTSRMKCLAHMMRMDASSSYRSAVKLIGGVQASGQSSVRVISSEARANIRECHLANERV